MYTKYRMNTNILKTSVTLIIMISNTTNRLVIKDADSTVIFHKVKTVSVIYLPYSAIAIILCKVKFCEPTSSYVKCGLTQSKEEHF